MNEPPHLRILCADDDEMVRKMISARLARAGHEVHSVGDGREALAAIAKHPAGFFDLVITDTRMPHLSGKALVKQARSGGYGGKFIVFAGLLQAEDRDAYEKLHVDFIVDKPAAEDELVRAVEAVAAKIA